jgi:phosphate transport system substrate-binding protein
MKINHLLGKITCPTLIFTLIFISCGGPKQEPQTPVAGYITVKGSEEVLPMLMEQAYAFMDLYVKAKVLVLDGGSDKALAAIFTDSAQVAYTTRPMSNAELERSKQAGFKVNEYKICKDGIAIIVNPKNPIKKLGVEQVIDIFTGKIKSWADGSLIRVCIWDDNSGTFEYFRDSILKGKAYSKQAWQFATTEDIIKHIDQEKSAIGMISMSRLYRDWGPLVEETRVKALPISITNKDNFIYPDEATVHEGIYPLIRYIYMYTPNDPKGLDSGFISFITSTAGQKIIAGNGLVPITIPVKYKKETM